MRDRFSPVRSLTGTSGEKLHKSVQAVCEGPVGVLLITNQFRHSLEGLVERGHVFGIDEDAFV